jgi:hypothetical protein
MTFPTFTQHFFAEKCTLLLPDNNFEKSFSRSLLLHLLFNPASAKWTNQVSKKFGIKKKNSHRVNIDLECSLKKKNSKSITFSLPQKKPIQSRSGAPSADW